MTLSTRLAGAGLLVLATCRPAAAAPWTAALDETLQQLTRENAFSGAVVVRGADGVLFARGYGFADPFTGRPFTPDTPVDSASLAKPVTAAAVLMLARDGKLDLGERVQRYLQEYPHPQTTVAQLLAHSAALPGDDALEPLADKTNEDLLVEIARRKLPPSFPPGTRFSYCNICYSTLAVLIERVSGQPYMEFARSRLALPSNVTTRPRALSDWANRAVGFKRVGEGKIERADSYEGEAFYGSANLSITAGQLARWGAEWWKPTFAPILRTATTPATVAGKASGLTWGSWYCAPKDRRCHYVGHHAGFHHLLYWDGERRLTVAMVSNNTLAPALQQRLQRALVAFSEDRTAEGRHELARPLPETMAEPGAYRTDSGERIVITQTEGPVRHVTRKGLTYPAYPMGPRVRYVPGLDAYIASSQDGLQWLTLYEDVKAQRR